jgi:hypothetical protein
VSLFYNHRQASNHIGGNMDLLRDGIWQFFGAVLGLIAIIVSVIIYLRQRGRKQISCEVVSKSTIVRISDEVKTKLQR